MISTRASVLDSVINSESTFPLELIGSAKTVSTLPRSLGIHSEIIPSCSHDESHLRSSTLTSTHHPLRHDPGAEPGMPAAKLTRVNLIVFQVSSINFLISMSSGLIMIALPRMAVDLKLPERLYLWPSSAFGLTTGSTLLIAGAVADVVGARSLELLAIALLGVFTLACGLSSTGVQLVVFRALQGVAQAMHLPCSVSLVTKYVSSGRRRNLSFACLGFSMPLGFSVGLVLGGLLVDTIGWRVGFYISGAIMLVQAVAGFGLIPAETRSGQVLHKLKNDIDWIGAIIASTGLALLSYTLSILSTDSDNMKKPSSIAMLVVSVCLLVVFPVWISLQEKKGRPALIPNHLWRNLSFPTVCILTMIAWGFSNAMELFSGLYFQEVQEFSALQASLRLLPNLLVGVFVNLATGYIIDRVSTFWLVLGAVVLTSVSPLLMALIDPQWSYWKGAFFAQCLGPLACDMLFTTGLIVVSGVFPEETQALAGAVFNIVAYFGMAIGLNLMQVVSLLVTKGTQYRDKNYSTALLRGYRASFWTMFALMMTSVVLCVFGLRKIGRVGLKRD